MQLSFSIPLEAGFNLIPCCKEQQYSPPDKAKDKGFIPHTGITSERQK